MFPLKNWHNLKRGYTFGVKTFYNDFHLGLDLIVPVGPPIYAPSNGRLQYAYGKEGGNMAFFTDKQKNIIRFLHCSEVKQPRTYKKGDVIALSGNTGMGTGPHVHIDVSKKHVDIYDTNNFINPELYFMRTLKCLIVTDKREDWSVISDWYLKHGVILKITEYYSNKKPKWIEYSSQSGKHVDMKWWDATIAHLATGYDICVVATKMKWWANDNINGYANNHQRLGIWTVFAKNQTGSRRKSSKLPNNIIGTLIHELSHIAYHATNKRDATHELDYKGKLDKMKIDWDNFIGWKIEGTTRLFKFSNIENKIIQLKVTDTMANRFKEKIGYWKLKGGYSTNIPKV